MIIGFALDKETNGAYFPSLRSQKNRQDMNRQHLLPIIALLVLGCTALLFGQPGAPIGEKYRLTGEEQYSEPVHFWLIPDGPEDAAQVRRVGAGQIRQLDAAAGVPQPEGLLRPFVSANGRYWGTAALSGDPAGDRQLSIAVYEGAGTLRYRLERVQHYDDPLPLLRLSGRDGALLIARSSTGQVWFYDRRGALLREVELFPNLAYDLERIVALEVSANAKSVAVLAGKRGASPAGSDAPNPSAEPHLFLFSAEGELRWQQPLNEYTPGALAVSPEGNYLAAAGYTIDVDGRITQRSVIYDRAGEIVMELPRRFELAYFSADEQFLLLTGKKSTQLIDLKSGAVRWERQISRNKEQICAVRVAGGARTIALLSAVSEYGPNGFVFNHPHLEILGRNGDLLQELTFLEAEFREPALLLAPDAQTLFIGFQHQHLIYRAQ